ncbi:MAG: hypothetical protein IKQ72_11950 [Bacteroidaceae bacterium]|nr:hypothetical protein [Bacteroidaceae bacterium]
MNRLLIFAISISTSMCSFAQWVKPAPPAIGQMSIDTGCYLYNMEANGFLTGGNEWGTRASISEKHGSKIYFDLSIIDNNWDGESYYIINDIENGNNAGQKGYMFVENLIDIYMDGTMDENKNYMFTIDKNEDGTFRIGLSNKNETYNKTDYPNTYLGIIPEKEDTRIYCCNVTEASEGFNPVTFQSTWYIVSEKEYKNYIDKLIQYNEALALGKTLELAKDVEGIDEEVMFDATFAYEHNFTPKEDIIEANLKLKEEIKRIKFANASVDAPAEILCIIDSVEQTFTDKQYKGWTIDSNAKNKQVNVTAAKDINITGYHLENWNDEALGNGSIYAKVTDIPEGVYMFSSLAFTTDSLTTVAFAGNDTTYVKPSVIDIDRPTEVMTIATNKELTFGLRLINSNANWVGLDNVNLYYLGNSFEAYKKMADAYVSHNKDYTSIIENGEITYYSNEHYNEYKAAIKNLDNATTIDEIRTYLNDYKRAIENLLSSTSAYEAYVASYTNAGMWLTMQSITNESVDLLDKYINGKEEPLGFNGNGNATFILHALDLTLDEILEEKEYLDKLYDDAYASILEDGNDCTKLIKNPKFNEDNGWISTTGPKWPAGNTELFPVFEAWNMVCDVYQELTNLQNGLYEMDINAVFRPGNEYNVENISKANAVIYLNSFEENVLCGNISTGEEASELFNKGKYSLKVYGLVTDGKLRIGIKNKNRLVEGSAIWAGGVSLKYYNKNPEALAEAITHTIPYAKEVFDNSYCGVAEKDALNYAITFANQEDDPFEELINLKNSIDNVIEGNSLYNKLEYAVNLLYTTIEESKADENTKKTLREIYFNISSQLNRHELTNAKAKESIAKIYESIVLAKRYGYEEGSEDNPVNYSDLIINNDFAPEEGSLNDMNINAWTSTAMNGYKLNTVSYNRSEYELNQTIYGLKKGKYKVTVYGYYRAGYYNEEVKHISDSLNTHLATLYATTPSETYTTSIMNLTEGASDTPESEEDCIQFSNGKYIPNSTSSSVQYFDKGYYLNELVFELKESGPVKIGISKKGVFANDYSVIGRWELWNMGIVNDVIGIDDVKSNDHNVTTDIFYIDGTRISEPKKGINIVRENDGTVKKIQN